MKNPCVEELRKFPVSARKKHPRAVLSVLWQKPLELLQVVDCRILRCG
jgi:hypothetical protein